MNKDDMIQAAEEEWSSAKAFAPDFVDSVEYYSWHWFWLILAESIWPCEATR